MFFISTWYILEVFFFTSKNLLRELLKMFKEEPPISTPTLWKSQRFKNWLRAYLWLQGADFIPFQDEPCLERALTNHLVRSGTSLEKIQQNYGQSILPDSLLTWVTNGQWQYEWLKKQLEIYAHDKRCMVFNSSDIPHLRDRTILLLDLAQKDRTSKNIFVGELEKIWHKQVEQDRVITRFFESETEIKLRMLSDWATKNGRLFGFKQLPTLSINLQPPIVANGYIITSLDLALIFFNWVLFYETIQKVCLDALKKRWSQAKYRNNLKGKKQCNFVLSAESLKILDGIAERNLLSRAKILEILIKSEGMKKLYVSEWIKVAKSVE